MWPHNAHIGPLDEPVWPHLRSGHEPHAPRRQDPSPATTLFATTLGVLQAQWGMVQWHGRPALTRKTLVRIQVSQSPSSYPEHALELPLVLGPQPQRERSIVVEPSQLLVVAPHLVEQGNAARGGPLLGVPEGGHHRFAMRV